MAARRDRSPVRGQRQVGRADMGRLARALAGLRRITAQCSDLGCREAVDEDRFRGAARDVEISGHMALTRLWYVSASLSAHG